MVKVIFFTFCISILLIASSAGNRGASGSMKDDSVTLSSADRIAASPDIAVGQDGSINVIWVDKGIAKRIEAETSSARGPQSGGHTHLTYNDLFFTRSTDGGKTFTAPMRINATSDEVWGFATSRPRIAVSKSGIIHIFYHANRFERSASRQAVDARYMRSSDGGKTFEKARTLNAFAAGHDDGELSEAHCFGTMGVSPNGDVHAFWIDTRHMGSEKDNGAVYGAVSRDEGKTFEKERLIFQNEACPCCQLNIGFSADNRIYLTLRSVYADGSRDSTIAQSDDGGKTFRPRVRVSNKSWIINGCPLKPLNITVDQKGRVYAAWFAGEMQPAGVYFAVSEDNGGTFAAPQQLHPEANLPDHAQIAVTADGLVRVIWDARVGESKRIFLRSSNDHGKTLGPVMKLPMPAGNALNPVIKSIRNQVFIAWQLNGQIKFRAL
ncbi:MAG: glycoside hydrolase [Acidobacteria bacterium]|nr:glycoside hydrolase [Acidobacteriota bacterium]